MSEFQRPANEIREITDIIERLYGISNDGLQKIIEESSATITREKERRLSGEFGEQAKETHTLEESKALTTITLAYEFIQSRQDKTDFDPYEFMGIRPAPALTVVP